MRPAEELPKRIGFFDRRDMYFEADPYRWSLLLFLCGGALWILRRLSVFETLKRIVLVGKAMPAAFLDAYLLFNWVLAAVTFCFFEACIPAWSFAGLPQLCVFFCFWIVVQVLQTSIYHELWRPAQLLARGISPDVSYSRLRNLLIGVCNYLYVTCLFGMIYWKLGEKFMQTIIEDDKVTRKAFDSLFDAVYFSFTVAWSCGSLGIAPRDLGPWGRLAVIAQIVCTLVLFSILISLSISAVRSTGEKPRSADEATAAATQAQSDSRLSSLDPETPSQSGAVTC